MVNDEKLERQVVLDFIENLEDLPSLPSVVEKVLKLCNDPLTSAGDLEKVFATDAALTSKVLRLVNSSCFALPNRVANVTRAIAFLGFNAVKSIALSISLPTILPDGDDVKLNYDDLWDHSLAVAECARILAVQSELNQVAEDLYVVGLLHDIGKVVLQQYFFEDFNYCLEEAELENRQLLEIEHEVFGLNHAVLGSYLAETWKFTPDIISNIKYHHIYSTDSERFKIPFIINASDYYAHLFKIGSSGLPDLPKPNPSAMDTYRMSGEKLADLEKVVNERVRITKSFIEE